MPIREDIIFGPGKNGGQVTFGEVRGMNTADQMLVLKGRFDAFLVSQVDELARDANGNVKVNSPFPLFLLCLVAFETLGKGLFRPKNGSDENAQKEGFLEVAKRIDPKLSKPLAGQEKNDYDALWGQDSHKKVSSKAEILYKFGRHTMAHGYRGKGVYITGEDTLGVWQMRSGAIELNPYLLWKEFRRVYDDAWNELNGETEPTSPRIRSALIYLNEILNE